MLTSIGRDAVLGQSTHADLRIGRTLVRKHLPEPLLGACQAGGGRTFAEDPDQGAQHPVVRAPVEALEVRLRPRLALRRGAAYTFRSDPNHLPRVPGP